MKNEIYFKWNSFGFLEGLEEKNALVLAEKFEELTNFILKNDRYKENEIITVYSYCILRGAFENGLNEKYSPHALCEKIEKEFSKISYSNNTFDKDNEIEICNDIIHYFSRNDKNKKPKL